MCPTDKSHSVWSCRFRSLLYSGFFLVRRPSCDVVAGLYFDFHIGSYSKSFVYTLDRPSDFYFHRSGTRFHLSRPLELPSQTNRNRENIVVRAQPPPNLCKLNPRHLLPRSRAALRQYTLHHGAKLAGPQVQMGRGQFLPAGRCGRRIAVRQHIDGSGGRTNSLEYETQGSGKYSAANLKISCWL